MNLFNTALTVYKKENEITLTNISTRNTIHSMLRKMLISQHLSNINFSKTTYRQIYKAIQYARGFLQIKNTSEDTPKEIRAQINKAFENKLIPLPDTPEQIPKEIVEILPFKLPITQRSHTRAVVNALRKIFKFPELPDAYFAKLPLLPPHYNELTASLRQLFPITHHSSLQHLAAYKRKLADFYTVTKIPDSYFDLPPPKKPLPTTYQELNHKVRKFFPFNQATSTVPLAEVVSQLREYYIFKLLPNDFFATKPPLPTDISKIKTTSPFNFPITDDAEAREFIKQVSPYYRVPFPIPTEIMQANPTNKPTLPTAEEIKEYHNISFPITTTQQLTATAKLLRKHYYFTRLPSEWIQIESSPSTTSDNTNTPTMQNLPNIPNNIEEIINTLSKQEIIVSLPIQNQPDITPTMKILKQFYTIKKIPEALLDLPPLPAPSWSIFKSAPLPSRPNTPSTVLSLASITPTPENALVASTLTEEPNTIATTAIESTLSTNTNTPPLDNSTPMDTNEHSHE